MVNNMPYTAPSVVDDVVPFAEGFIAVGHDGYYSLESNAELDNNVCGYSDEWTGSCRTDAAVWIGTWDNG
jgi:hypothetical protein